jgi:methionine--tRNA ligase beta chain
MINIEDFLKLDIRIGKVVSAEKIPEGDKLLKLMVDFGAETRQIMSGIAEYYSDPSVLVGQQMPFIINLETRKLRGYESQGMILAASGVDRPVLIHPEIEVPSGSKVK